MLSRLRSFTRHTGIAVPRVLLFALLLAAFLGVGFHVLTAGHDSAQCPACTWFQVQGWIVAGFALLLCLALQGLARRPHLRSFSISRLSSRPRAPPGA